VSLVQLVDERTGLGFRQQAAERPADGAAGSDEAALFDCVYRDVQCTAENAISRTMPRAYEFLSEVRDDVDDVFVCVTDPDGLE
jgi:hypothetical protein